MWLEVARELPVLLLDCEESPTCRLREEFKLLGLAVANERMVWFWFCYLDANNIRRAIAGLLIESSRLHVFSLQ